MKKILKISALLSLILFPLQKSTADCTTSLMTITINGNCKFTIRCGSETHWFSCCSDLGQDLGKCPMEIPPQTN